MVTLQKFFEPRLYDRCVARFKEDEMLYRGTIVQMEDSPIPQQLLIFFVDYGNREWVSRDDVYPLPAKFTTIPPQVCTYLVGFTGIWNTKLPVYRLDCKSELARESLG